MPRLPSIAFALPLLVGLVGCSTLPEPSGHQEQSVEQSPNACAVDGVRTIARPETRGSSSTFPYAFRVHRATADSATPAPAVIYLPGGPGQDSIRTPREQIPVPLDLDVIATDPRGTGCNSPAEGVVHPDAFYRTDEIADDILAIVEELKLDHYYLYGVSYGTYLATVVAARAEQRRLAAPRALILEGVLGRTFAPHETEVAYQERWTAIRDSLPEAARDKIVAPTPPLGFTPKEWGAFIRTGLSIGRIANAPATHLGSLLSLLVSDDPEVTKPLEDTVRSMAAEDRGYFESPTFLRVYEYVGCREVAETMSIDFELRSGELVSRQDLCGHLDVVEPYSAQSHQVTMPIYYIEGTHDPNTPFWQAEFHFEHQPRARRALIGVAEAGHNPLALNLGACSGSLWYSILNDGAELSEAVATCPEGTTLRTAEPEPGTR